MPEPNNKGQRHVESSGFNYGSFRHGVGGQCQTITDPAQIAAGLHFWAQETGDPVYYGEVRDVDPQTMQVLGHYQCLAIAFIKYEGGVFYYAHKMWSKSPDGSCHYDDVTT